MKLFFFYLHSHLLSRLPTSEHFIGCQYVISKRFYSQVLIFLWFLHSFQTPTSYKQLNFGLLSIPKKGKMKEVVNLCLGSQNHSQNQGISFSLN